MAGELVDPHVFQLIVLCLNGLGALCLVLFSLYLKGSREAQHETNLALKEVVANLQELNNLILQHYTTKEELNRVDSTLKEKVRDLREDSLYHTVCLALLCKHVNMDQPAKS